MVVSRPEAGPVLAMLAVAMLTMTMLPMRWDGAPAPAVVATSNTSAVNMPLPSSPFPPVSHASWQKVGNKLNQLTSRLCDLALSKINSALLSVLLYLLKTVVLPKLPFNLVYSQKKDTKDVELKKDTKDVDRYRKNDAKDVGSVQQTQHAVQQQRQQLGHRAPAGAAHSMQHELLLFEQPEEQPEHQPEVQHQGVQQQGIDLRMMNLEAMTIAKLKDLAIEQNIGGGDELWTLINARNTAKADYVAFIRRNRNQM